MLASSISRSKRGSTISRTAFSSAAPPPAGGSPPYLSPTTQIENTSDVFQSDIVLKVRPPTLNTAINKHELSLMRPGGLGIGFFFPAQHPELVALLKKHHLSYLAMDSVPRISRAQVSNHIPQWLRYLSRYDVNNPCLRNNDERYLKTKESHRLQCSSEAPLCIHVSVSKKISPRDSQQSHRSVNCELAPMSFHF